MTASSRVSTISTAPYELVPRQKLGSHASSAPRKGVLLKVRFSDRKVGYADCFPWRELGDLSLTDQLEYLKKGQFTELTHRSVEFARVDAEARSLNQSVWNDLQVPPSHALITDLNQLSPIELETLAHQGFGLLKVKVGVHPANEAKVLKSWIPDLQRLNLKLRLDFNASLNETSFDKFLADVDSMFEYIDFIEDPTTYDPALWSQVQKRTGVRLALDRIPPHRLEGLEPESFSVLIFKPAIQTRDWVVETAKKMGVSVVVTSYLDHPLGQLCAAWSAALLKCNPEVTVETCGLLSHSAYRFHPFAEKLRTKKAVLIPPDGTGFGMDDLLGQLEWTPLRKESYDPLAFV